MTTTRPGATETVSGSGFVGAPAAAVRERARAMRAMIEALPGFSVGHEAGMGGPGVLLVVGVDISAVGVGYLLAGAFAESRQRTLLIEAAVPAGGSEHGHDRRPSREHDRRPSRREVEDQLALALGKGSGGGVGASVNGPGPGPMGGLVEWGSGREGPHALPVRSTGSPYLVTVPHGEAIPGQPVMAPDRWATLLGHARDERDRVIVVASPLSRRADGLTLARLVDGVVLALAPGHTTATAATRVQDAIRQAGGNVLGVVLADR